jgi:hypothetical protein
MSLVLWEKVSLVWSKNFPSKACIHAKQKDSSTSGQSTSQTIIRIICLSKPEVSSGSFFFLPYSEMMQNKKFVFKFCLNHACALAADSEVDVGMRRHVDLIIIKSLISQNYWEPCGQLFP